MDYAPFQPYFNRNEPWGDPDKVQWYHVWHLWVVRYELIEMGYNWPVSIHCSYELTGHSDKSFHGMGLATDFHFLRTNGTTIQDQFCIMVEVLKRLRLDLFTGLGVYPHWNSPGFHLDTRGEQLFWVRDINGRYKYGLDRATVYLQALAT